jgi:hypothetical protein
MNAFLARLLRSRTLAAAAGAWLVAAVLLCALPLTNVPGYLHALALNLLTGTFGLWIAIVVGRAAGSADGGGPPLLRLAAPSATSFVLLAVLVGLSLAVAWINGLRVGLCDPWAALGFYPVLPLASAVLVAVAGAAIAAATTRRTSAASLAVVLVLVTGAVTAWPILTGPQAFAFNHLLGHVPGPLYDERAEIGPALLGYRGLTLAWALALFAGAALHLRPGRFALYRWPHRGRPVAVTLLVSALALGAVLQHRRSELGFFQNDRSVARALGGVVETEHFVIHYPAERSADWVARTVRDHEFQYAEVRAWLALPEGAGAPIVSYVFRSASEKGDLTGAARTSIAKPWLGAMYIHDQGYPHGVLKHELVHVLAAKFGSFPFRASSRSPLAMNTGLVEGLAVAADWRADELSVHGWARAMREVGVAPDVRDLFTASGFFSQSSARAYTLAGSFVRWLADTHGIDAVKAAYRAGDLSVVDDPGLLFAAWETFLDAEPVDPAVRRLAEHRFRRPSILRRPCAFDVSTARQRGREALRAGRHAEAHRHFRRAAELEPQDPWHLKGLLDTHLAADEDADARRVAEDLLVHPNADDRLKAEAAMTLGDLAWRNGDLEAAAERFAEVTAFSTGEALGRLAVAKGIVVADPILAEGLRDFLQGRLRRDLGLLILRDLLDERPDEPLVHYLLGRQLHTVGVYERAIRHLEAADALGLPDAGGLRLENLRLIARAWYESGDHPAAADAWRRLAEDPGAGEGARLQAADWKRRARFLATFSASR